MREQEEHAIIARLAGNRPEDLRSAAFEAAAARLAAAVPDLVALLQFPHAGVQEAAEEALCIIRGQDAVQALIPLLRSDSALTRNCAIHILCVIGDDDPETLVSLMKDSEPSVRLFVADILGTLKYAGALESLLEALLHDSEANVRHQAAVALGRLGLPAAVPALSQAMQDEEWVQFAAVEALARIRSELCLDALMRALENCSDVVASMIIEAFGEIRHHRTLEFLLEQLDTASVALRNKVVKALVKMLGESVYLLRSDKREVFRQALLEALEEDDSEIVLAALQGLSGMGTPEASGRVIARGIHCDPDAAPEMADAFINCLVAMGFNEALEEALRDFGTEESGLALRACCAFPDTTAVTTLISIFDSLDRDGQRMAAYHLSLRAPMAEAPFFRSLLEREGLDAHVHKAALQFLGMKARDGKSGARILSFLRHRYNDVKETALEACLALNDPQINKGVVELARESDTLLRMMGVYAMGRLGVEKYFDDLCLALRDPVAEVRKVALDAIALESRRLKERLPVLLPCLKDESSEVRMAMIDVLAQSSFVEADELIIQALEDEDGWVCIRAVEALADRLGPQSIPYLLPLLEDSRIMIMIKAVEVLGEVGDASVVKALSSLFAHEEYDVRYAVSASLSRLVRQGGDAG